MSKKKQIPGDEKTLTEDDIKKCVQKIKDMKQPINVEESHCNAEDHVPDILAQQLDKWRKHDTEEENQ